MSALVLITRGTAEPDRGVARLAWVDVLRGLAILAVVLYHADLQVSLGLDTRLGVITTINDTIGPFRMPILMFLSGILLPISLAKPANIYLKGKFGKIAWPYFVWSFANLAVLVAASSAREEVVGLGHFGRVFYAPPTYHWYLAYLVVFYVLALPFAGLPRVRLATIPLALVGAAFSDGQWERFLFLWAFFMAGDFVARHWDQLKGLVSRPWVVAICAIAAVPVLFSAATGDDLRYDSWWAVGILAAVFALRPLMQFVAPTLIGVGLAAVGRQSIVYYVSHYLVITLAFHALTRLVGVTSPWLLFVVTSVVALALGFILVRLRRYSVVGWLFEWAPKRELSADSRALR
ncbi:acyltransferase [Rhodococcus sp. IEGM 1408]|uniref:acyltransferase n=1 Tax=Rhodococcus sp. IEGM 1408 TaxID=3082220 RepID=UPI002954D8C0|nr:acyltransferase [Rhodococcus sp. IEGM 1408]MDV8003152.1 acyltransferase [Rhodococcus sp. IEGM 1408]